MFEIEDADDRRGLDRSVDSDVLGERVSVEQGWGADVVERFGNGIDEAEDLSRHVAIPARFEEAAAILEECAERVAPMVIGSDRQRVALDRKAARHVKAIAGRLVKPCEARAHRLTPRRVDGRIRRQVLAPTGKEVFFADRYDRRDGYGGLLTDVLKDPSFEFRIANGMLGDLADSPAPVEGHFIDLVRAHVVQPSMHRSLDGIRCERVVD
ncbi:hypothetical protein GCM10028857_10450 [Salinarchaeum chitinilyticum]